MSLRLLIIGPLSLSCAASVDVVSLEVDSAKSLILVWVQPSGSLTGRAVELSSDSVLSVPLDEPRGLGTIYALEFGCGLPVMGLQKEGVIRLGETGGRLPAPARTRVLEGDRWAESELPGEIARARIEGIVEPTACLALVETSVDLVGSSTSAHVLAVVPLSHGGWLVTTTDGQFYDLTPRIAEVELVALPLDLDPTSPRSGGFEWKDELWMVGEGGRVMRRRESTWEMGPPLTTRAEPDDGFQLDGDTSGRTTELFAQSDYGELHRFDGSSWALVSRSETRGSGGRKRFDVEVTGPGEAFALGPEMNQDGDSSSLVHYSQGEVTSIEGPPPADKLGRINVMTFVPGLGIVIGTQSGALFSLDGESWVPVADLERTPVYVIAPAGPRSVIAGGNGGRLTQVVAGGEDCGVIHSIETTLLTRVVANGHRFAAIGPHLRTGRDTPSVAVLTAQLDADAPRAESCSTMP